MVDPKIAMEVPPQVREFAVKSVEQAEQAISKFMESASKSIALVPSPMSDIAKQALMITEANIKATLEHARNLMEAKDIGDVLRLQTEFVRSQFGTATEQFKQMAGTATASGEKPEGLSRATEVAHEFGARR
jgi:phasin